MLYLGQPAGLCSLCHSVCVEKRLEITGETSIQTNIHPYSKIVYLHFFLYVFVYQIAINERISMRTLQKEINKNCSKSSVCCQMNCKVKKIEQIL